ncbi:HNH endonuclease [Streptomyces rimosus subsp. pseudoverticillatus]|uniref:HNH endonuclease signature motif containing protein n=1 Tax=Streptomyces rimosus TaxID=1927 RepID=UPI0006B2924E|nr:HNH endonuclease signature motif containing protein [Streptomyces rimosus]KOT98863.1 HNH endonuclease [Streptomyces rimosus subsp. pseudoverticillatus]
MTARRRYTRGELARTAAASTGPVDMLRRLGTPLGSGTLRYLRRRLAHYGIDTTHFVPEELPRRPPQTYTRKRLEEAAAQARSIRDVLDHLGVAPYDSAYSHIRRKLTRFGISTAHFTGRGARGELLPRDELTAAVAGSRSRAATLRLLGRPVTTSSRRLLDRSITAHGLSTAHFTGQGHGRGRPSPARRPADDILRHRPPGSRRTKTSLLRRALDDKAVPRQCDACGLGESWQGRRLVLEIDHINGNRLDDRIGNLRYLCPSCHSQTRTFGRRTARTQDPLTAAQPGTVQ